MSKAVDLSQKRFGQLLALEPTSKRKNNFIVWKCRCDCGNIAEVASCDLIHNRVISCGCYQTKYRDKAFRDNDVEGTNLLLLNARVGKNNKSGCKGVFWEKSRNKWAVYIGFKGQRIFCGRFADKEQAIKARKNAEEKYFEPILNQYGRELI